VSKEVISNLTSWALNIAPRNPIEEASDGCDSNAAAHALHLEHVAAPLLNDLSLRHIGVEVFVLIDRLFPLPATVELKHSVRILEAFECAAQLTFADDLL